MMKPALQLRTGTHLTMTPQLQQAIHLLQLSTLDLQQELQMALESNPLLDIEEEQTLEVPETPLSQEEWSSDIPEELPLDARWDDVYTNGSASSNVADDSWNIEHNAVAVDLTSHLREQILLMDMTPREQLITDTLLDALEPSGYLGTGLEDLGEGLRQQGLGDLKQSEMEHMLSQLQRCEPTGVFARDLRECLLLQLDLLPDDTPWLAQTRRMVRQFLEPLGQNDRRLLKRRLSLDDEALDDVIHTIRSLNPRPGREFEAVDQHLVIPDLVLRYHARHGWQVELNQESLPRLRIQPDYAALVRRADKSDDNTFLKQHLQDARWLLKSLSSRNDTLLRVGQEIMTRQAGFIEHGDEALKPMILADIAQAVEMHESTISRVTTRKYIHTPRGIMELKYFFSSHVGQEGDAHASTAIRARIRKFIEDETPRRPLSDARLVQLLADNGIMVARRTVAKYREAMGIPASSERKRLA
ncbi:RNA polymerase factor sigma-54 [Kushneria marisflavi]|uniref:RNA polymerase sigma-54 factor n=1 Tax=Kushneria marisflavi TaxID=157779 RepID=A0A240UT37_9GAMM|nr:RNA polymerase factor sigma-54 [Kushneria marisflavi]ART64243.1 RNA polymerase factor sigma-54 [Kushneria marisflavi]RKD76705.1 RNA polymerase RpoN-/SigL-like sigma 54 subunit [Kushneria marisflavi]